MRHRKTEDVEITERGLGRTDTEEWGSAGLCRRQRRGRVSKSGLTPNARTNFKTAKSSEIWKVRAKVGHFLDWPPYIEGEDVMIVIM